MSLLKKLKLHKVRFRLFKLEKRERFAISVILLTLGIFLIQLVLSDIRFYLVAFMCLASYLLTAWSLREDIKRTEWITLFILPVSFTGLVSFFYFLLPERMIVRLFTTGAFAIGMYAILLVENIFNVAGERSIQLLRAAHSVGFLLSLVVIYLSSTVLYSLRLPFWANFICLFIIGFFLGLQFLWSTRLEEKISEEIIMYTLLVALGVGEIGMVLSFWPVLPASFSLAITAAFYSLTGIFQLHLLGRLFRPSIREYAVVFVGVMFLIFITTTWG